MRKQSKTTKKKPKISTYSNKAKKLWSRIVKERAGYRCEYCGSTQYLNSHHHYSVRCAPLKYDLDNGVCLCSSHHIWDTKFSAHRTPALFVKWIEAKRGKVWARNLELKNQMIVNYKINDLKKIIKGLEEELE